MTSISPRQARLLHLLLNRYERAAPGRTSSVTVTFERFPEYFSDASPGLVRQWEDEVRALELLGWVGLDWGKGADSHRLIRVRLTVACVGLIEEALGRMSAERFSAAMAAIYSALLSEAPPPWLRAFFEEEREAGKIQAVPPAELREERLNDTELLCTALIRLAANANRLTWRQFSVAHFSNSKKLLSLKPRICRILAHHFLGQEDEIIDESAVLAAVSIELKASIVLLRGPVRIDFPSRKLQVDAGQWSPFLALPEQMLEESTLDTQGATGILTIENEESYHSFARSGAKPEWIVLYVGGFPTRARLGLLKKLGESELPFYHWGDLDCGGIEILLFLERELGVAVCPVGMEPARLHELASSCKSLNGREMAHLQRIQERLPLRHALVPLLWELLSTGRKLEQEAILDPFGAG